MSEKTTKLDLNDEISLDFWKMFHSLLRHGTAEADVADAQERFAWLSDHVHTFRKAIVTLSSEFEILAVLWKIAAENKEMPGYIPVRERVEALQQNAGLLVSLEDYEDLVKNKQLKVRPIPDMWDILNNLCLNNAKMRVELIARGMIKINETGMKDPDSKVDLTLQGPKAALGYAVREMEKGVFLNSAGTSNVIVVNNEADKIVDVYEAREQVPRFEVGVKEIQLEAGDVLGVLGYKGSGKTTFSRYGAYGVAENGYNVLHVALENSKLEADTWKYIFIHSQNPKFHGDFEFLKWSAWVNRELNKEQLNALDFVAKDFKKTFEGRLILREPSSDGWHTIKTMIETQAINTPIHFILLDYIQIMSPALDRSLDERGRMKAMIRDIRQFAKQMGVAIMSPVQANETGYEYAAKHEGVFPLNAVNNDKELSGSMTHMVGVFDMGTVNNQKIMVISSQKNRDLGPFAPMNYVLHPAGWWFQPGKQVKFDAAQAMKVAQTYMGMSAQMMKQELG